MSNNMSKFKRVLYIGTVPGYRPGIRSGLAVEIQYEDNCLSLSGIMGGSAGQIQGEFDHRDPKANDHRTTYPIKATDIHYAPGWNANLWLDLLDVWDKWHLNDMKAGSPAQDAYLAEHQGEFVGHDHYK